MKITKRKLLELIKENLGEDSSSVTSEVQMIIDSNQYLAGQKVSEGNIVAGPNYVLFLGSAGLNHIKARHADAAAPGSLFDDKINLNQLASKLLSTDKNGKPVYEPNEIKGGRVKWLAVDVNQLVGYEGVDITTTEEVMTYPQMETPGRGRLDIIRYKVGNRPPTQLANLVTAEIGTLQDGRKLLSVLTMFPGALSINGIEIPADRNAFESKGLYFIVSGQQ